MTARRGRAGGPAAVASMVAVLLVLLAAAVVAYLLFVGAGGYHVKAVFLDAGQLVRGNQVQAGGVAIGSVEDVDVTQNGQAQVTLEIDNDDFEPLRRGTRLLIRQTSLSGIANRVVDVQVGPDNGAEIPDGGRIDADDTQTAVELDSVFSIFDQRTQKATQDFIAGQAEAIRGRGLQLQAGVRDLNPALSTGSRLFGELTRDHRLLRDFLVDSSALVTALGERRGDLEGVVRNLNTTFRALGGQQAALAESIERLPPFMRLANTTFVNLRAALDDVDPLVDAAKPVARRLGPFLGEARLFARDAEPTVRDLSRTINSPGRDNDLIELIDSFPPLARAALDPRRVNGATRRGAFPETAEALRDAAPTIAQGRPYTPDLVGWLDDFSATGAYDALGGFSRAWLNFSEILYGPGPKLRQFRRCPGANEEPASDRSNVFTAAEQSTLGCDGSQRSVGP
jgi:phospholipid/cholesterol/gamma-HCH transport system substrate-binding protein